MSQSSMLAKSVGYIRQKDYQSYLDLKQLLPVCTPEARLNFRKIFSSYYGLNSAGLTETFKDRYFELLFALSIDEKSDPYTPILQELWKFPRRTGDNSLQVSFTSKLVAIHDETRPIFDKFVSNFFGLSVPSIGDVEFRIAGFIRNIEIIRQTYIKWITQDKKIIGILETLIDKHPALEKCHSVRLIDFLVWTAGKYDRLDL